MLSVKREGVTGPLTALMPISYFNFRALSFEQQLVLVWAEGTYLTQRWEETDAVALYLMEGGFFCELYLEQIDYSVQQVLHFATTDSARLAEYARYIRLDDLPDT